MSVWGPLEQAVLMFLPLATSCTLDAHGLFFFPAVWSFPWSLGFLQSLRGYPLTWQRKAVFGRVLGLVS